MVVDFRRICGDHSPPHINSITMDAVKTSKFLCVHIAENLMHILNMTNLARMPGKTHPLLPHSVLQGVYREHPDQLHYFIVRKQQLIELTYCKGKNIIRVSESPSLKSWCCNRLGSGLYYPYESHYQNSILS